jgi:DNA-3-methyladenine glycosylase
MLNIVTSELNKAQAVLIRGIDNFDGPGKLSKELLINKSLNNEDLENSNQIWIEDNNTKYKVIKRTRIGIDYAGDYWKNKKWRFILDKE